MSRWFLDRRQEFIVATLRQFGQIRRADIVREFGITVQVASADIAAFLDAKPPRATYDVSAKTYVLVEEPASTTKPITSAELIAKLDDPDIAAAVNEQGGGRLA